MKVVRVTYFQPNGRFHKEDTLYLKENVSAADAFATLIPEQLDEPDMYVYVEDSRDGKEPFLMPHLYKPGAKKKAEERQKRAAKQQQAQKEKE